MATPNPLTSIPDQKTPGRPVEITFAAETGLPSALQELLLFGHAATGATGVNSVIQISNAGDFDAGKAEAETKFGVGSELAKMVAAAIKANQDTQRFVTIKCVPLANSDTAFGTSDAALTAAGKVKAEFIVSPYDLTDATLRDKIKDLAQVMSGPQRPDNNQFGTVATAFNRSVTDPSLLPAPDSQYFMGFWLPDTGTGGDAPAYSVAEMAAALTARVAANPVPFNPQDSEVIFGLDAPKLQTDWITVGASLESEVALGKGITPVRVKPNGDVAFVRTVTSRLTTNGITAVGAYYDVQDFQVLYYFRKTVWTRVNQPDFQTRKASQGAAQDLKSEVLRLMAAFQDQNMFQAVDQLAKQVVVQRSSTDRHRFDVFIPVNVIPGLHVIATNIQAGTQFDNFTI